MRPLNENPPPWRWLAALLPISAAFFYAPLAFGGTTFWTRVVIDWLLAHSFLLWVCVLVLDRRLPRLPVVLASSLGLLALLGLSQCLNPQSDVNPATFDVEPLEAHLPWLPGSIDAETSGWVLLHFLALMLAGLVVRDGMPGTRVRWFLFRVVALAGLVIAVIGIYQKAAHSEGMLWSRPMPYERGFFAAFRYHANAAAFLNLSWPAAFVVWIRSRLVRPGGIVASLDLCVFLVVFGAVFVNSSKAGLVLGLFGILLASWSFRRELFVATTSRAGHIVMAVFLGLAAAIIVLPGLFFTLSKWNELLTQGDTVHGRLYAYEACLLAIKDTGLFGAGAGTFQYVFPPYAQRIEGFEGFWQQAHQDWLQTIIEWGWIGFAAWAVVFGGAIVRLGRRINEARRADRPDLTASAASLALMIVVIHSLFDFPMQIPALQWLVVFYLAVAWSDARAPGREEPAAKG